MALDASFWLSISIIIFVCLVFKHAKLFILNNITSKIQSIDNKFKDILAISEEAENLLKEYRTLHHSSKQKVKDILTSAELEIKLLKEEAQQEISTKLKVRTENTLNKIHNNELKILSQLRLEALNSAISTSIAILSSDKNNQQQNQLIKTSIDAISSQIKGNTSHPS